MPFSQKSFVDLLKKKRRLAESEARHYLRQLLDAVQFMHRQRVIHRDLKLGNLFISAKMELKIGDFGLATTLQTDEDRKKYRRC